MIRARWFIKKNGQFEYPLAQGKFLIFDQEVFILIVYPTVKLSYRTGLRECIEKAQISDEKRAHVIKMLNQHPQRFKQALKDYMENKELDYMENQAKERILSFDS